MPIAEAACPLAVDLIEELRLRRWARENYCYTQARQTSWHPVIHDEMRRIDGELLEDQGLSLLCHDEFDQAPDDSTILSDETTDVLPAKERSPLKEVAAIGPIVPLAPDLSGLHGPHEITPPHSRIGIPADKAEMHYT